MFEINLEERKLATTIQKYLESKRNNDWPISISGAITAIRAVSRNLAVSDQELVDLIAKAAVANRRNIAFDFIVPTQIAAEQPMLGK